MDMEPSPNEVEAARLDALHRYDVLDTPPEASFDRITRTAQYILSTPIVLLSLIDADRQWIKSKRGLRRAEIPRTISLCARVVETGRPLVVDDALAEGPFSDNPLVTGAPNIRFYAGVPLTTPEGFHIGTLSAIDRTPRTLSKAKLGALRDLAALAVDIFELQKIAATDALTGLLTRRSFHRALAREMERAQRYRRTASLITFDIDHFKAINDTYGHAAGDAVLRSLGTVCRPILRSIDLLARHGGEEFALLLPETTERGGMDVAERLRHAIADAVIPFEDRMLKITSSFGVTVVGHTGDSTEAALDRADDALYEAKNSGRDRVVFKGADTGLSIVA